MSCWGFALVAQFYDFILRYCLSAKSYPYALRCLTTHILKSLSSAMEEEARKSWFIPSKPINVSPNLTWDLQGNKAIVPLPKIPSLNIRLQNVPCVVGWNENVVLILQPAILIVSMRKVPTRTCAIAEASYHSLTLSTYQRFEWNDCSPFMQYFC